MSQWVLIAANIAAVFILIFGIYFPRHRRRDMIVAFLAINTGVLAISSVLSTVNTSIGVGVGLFGVLSIIRLRSDELDQREVAYYFASLALGLLGGTQVDSLPVSLVLMTALLAVMWFGDHPRLLSRYRVQHITLDRAFVDEQQLSAHLALLLNAEIRRVNVRRIDLVNDTTMVEVRYEVINSAPVPARTAPASAASPARLAS